MRTRRFNLDDGARFVGPPLATRGNGGGAPSLNSMPGPTRHGSAQRKLIAVTWLLLVGGLVTVIVAEVSGLTGAAPGIGIALVLLGATAGGHEAKRITAGRMHRSGITIFTLSLDEEEVALDPGKTWQQVDHFKWVMRGLIESPQSFYVFPDGSLEINAEKITAIDPEGTAKLESQINKHHAPISSHASAPVAAPSHPAVTSVAPARPHFTVKLDHLGHMGIEWGQGIERDRTGLRGLATLAANGLIRKPREFHVDPLQRGIEIEGEWFECSEAGAKRLEEALNTRYAFDAGAGRTAAIEIKENHAASTGFDIHFTTHRVGFAAEVKGHFSQEYLDILQDPAKCDLIQPGIHMLISPPYLLFRRQRPDMGEERIPELPDLNLLRTSAAQLLQVLNHPLVRRGGSGAVAAAPTSEHQEQIAALRLVKRPADNALLWLECLSASGQTQATKAFTHHNLAELQHKGAFLPSLEVSLSLDHRRLSIFYRQSRRDEVFTLDPQSPEEELHRASLMLTQALKRSAPQPEPGRESPIRVDLNALAAAKTTASPAPVAVTGAPVTAAPLAAAPVDPPTTRPVAARDPLAALFGESDAVRINLEIFRRLGPWLGIQVQDLRLSLPLVFENRQFEVLNFEPQEIGSLMDLRGEDFYGFYLSHVSDQKLVLVYACNGMHIEWGPDKCVLQPTARSEAEEYKGSALLGLAQNRKNEFVFIVRPPFKAWILPREQPYTVENLRFLRVADIAADPGEYRLIWPERPTSTT